MEVNLPLSVPNRAILCFSPSLVLRSGTEEEGTAKREKTGSRRKEEESRRRGAKTKIGVPKLPPTGTWRLLPRGGIHPNPDFPIGTSPCANSLYAIASQPIF